LEKIYRVHRNSIGIRGSVENVLGKSPGDMKAFHFSKKQSLALYETLTFKIQFFVNQFPQENEQIKMKPFSSFLPFEFLKGLFINYALQNHIVDIWRKKREKILWTILKTPLQSNYMLDIDVLMKSYLSLLEQTLN
jgi:hypothetical protein